MLVSELRPGFGREVFDLPVGGVGQTGEDVTQIGVQKPNDELLGSRHIGRHCL